MSDETDTEPTQFFIRRSYPGGVISCGGPYPTRDAAHRAARRFRPANARSVEVREEPLAPAPSTGRHLVLRLRRKDFPDQAVTVGPFVSRREARNFLRRAAEPEHGSGPVPVSPLGSLARDWEPVEVNRTADLDLNSWLPDPRLSF
jgi:hypothetical protein